MAAVIVRCKIDNWNSVGPVQDKEVVRILAAESGTDYWYRTGGSVQWFEALANAL